MILYVSADRRGRRTRSSNINNVLSRYRSGKVSLTICDLARDPSVGDQDSIAFTPTLVKRSPGPRTFILGHITNPEVLMSCSKGARWRADGTGDHD